MEDFLRKLQEFLGEADLDGLVRRVETQSLYLGGVTTLSPVSRILLCMLEQFQGRACVDIQVQPPSCPSAILHWAVMLRLLPQLSEGERNIISSFPLVTQATYGIRVDTADGHCHLEHIARDFHRSPDAAMELAKEGKSPVMGQMRFIVSNCVYPGSWRKPPTLKDVQVFHTFGVHPRLAEDKDLPWETIEHRVKSVSCVGIGECGLDDTAGDWGAQLVLFRRQVAMARQFNKVLVLHLREDRWSGKVFHEAREVVQDILPRGHQIYLHCYMGDAEDFMKWKTAFPSVVAGFTWKSTLTPHFQKVAHLVPLESLAVESDAPLLSPTRDINSPYLIHHQAAAIGHVRNVPTSVILDASRRNLERCYLN